MNVVSPAPFIQHPVINRRRILFGATALVMMAVGTGCGFFSGEQKTVEPSDTPAEDPLLPIADAARTDAAMATQVASSSPAQAVQLAIIAADRTAHATALDAEIARAAGKGANSPSPVSASASAAPSTAVAPAPTVEGLRTRLQHNQSAAADLARTVPAYRAGLLGSVAAACAAELAVLL
ncbi:MAG: hypothetical protein ACXVXO_09010 [Mycobacteriaceae bacterium]